MPLINQQILYSYLKSVHIPERMVVAGVGMDHSKLVDLCRRYFVAEKRAIWEESKELAGAVKPIDKSVSQYTGGIITVGCDNYMGLGRQMSFDLNRLDGSVE